MRLKNKVILVTASTRGIGLAIVKKCAEEGAKVYMAARNMDRAQEIADTLEGVKCVYNDATKPETLSSMVEDVVRDAGHIDVLINNIQSREGFRFFQHRPASLHGYRGSKFAKCLYRKSGCGKAHGEPRRWQYHQYFFRGWTGAGYFSDCLWYQ